MREYGVIQYLLNAVENNYLEGLLFDKIEPSKFLLTAIVSNCQKIKPVMWMIEANVYTNKDLLADSVECFDNIVSIHSIEGVTYSINVIAK